MFLIFLTLLLCIVIFIYILNIKKNRNESFNSKNNIFTKPKSWNNLKYSDKLKLYCNSLDERIALYTDKYRVKKYIESLNIKDLIVPKLIKKLDKNNYTLNLNDLPSNCVIKTNNGSGDVIIIKNKSIKLMLKRGVKIDPDVANYKDWLNTCTNPHSTKYEKFYKYILPEVFVEEYLGDDINDFKFFCFNGKVHYFHIDSNRYSNHCRNNYDKNFNLLNFTSKYNKCNFNIEKPKNLNLLITIAEKLAEPFDFARIDLFNINNKVYFGEITFCPEATNVIIKPISYDYKIGKVWK